MDVSWLWGHARTDFYHCKKTIELPLKKPHASAHPTDLLDLCKRATPDCHLNPLLFNGHMQTAWTVLKSQRCPIHYKRHIFTSDHRSYPGSFAVDFVTQTPTKPEDEVSNLPPRTTFFSDSEFEALASDDDTPVLIALHGLSGGSYELYLRHVLAPLVGEEEIQRSGRPWQALVVNSRGCARSELTSGYMFNAKSTWDIEQVVKWARKTWPNRPLFGVGFSLGGNILTNVRMLRINHTRDAQELRLISHRAVCRRARRQVRAQGRGSRFKPVEP